MFRTRMCGQTLLFIAIANCTIALSPLHTCHLSLLIWQLGACQIKTCCTASSPMIRLVCQQRNHVPHWMCQCLLWPTLGSGLMTAAVLSNGSHIAVCVCATFITFMLWDKDDSALQLQPHSTIEIRLSSLSSSLSSFIIIITTSIISYYY